MNRKNSTRKDRKVALTVKKETLKDLNPQKTVVGGLIMRDTNIVRPTW